MAFMVFIILLAGVINVVFWLRFTGYFLEERFGNAEMWVVAFINIIPTIANIACYLVKGEMLNCIILNILCVVFSVLGVMWGYVGNGFERFFYGAFARLVIVLTDIFALQFAKYVFFVETENEKIYALLAFKIILMILIIVLKLLRPKQPYIIRKDIGLITVAFFIGCVVVDIWYDLIFMEYEFTRLETILFVLNIGIIGFLYYSMIVKSQEDVFEKNTINRLEIEKTWMGDIENETKKLRMLRHDMKNHIAILKVLSDTKQYDDLCEYIDDMYGEVDDASDVIVLDNTTLASLISRKKRMAKENGIKFESKIAVKYFDMDDMDVSTLFGNLFDNAIEAAGKVNNDSFIDFNFDFKDGKFIITCENSYAIEPKTKTGSDIFITSKPNEDNHGMGISSMKRVVEEYEGVMNMEFKDKIFKTEIVIPKRIVILSKKI